jgi:hypothetical protein
LCSLFHDELIGEEAFGVHRCLDQTNALHKLDGGLPVGEIGGAGRLTGFGCPEG